MKVHDVFLVSLGLCKDNNINLDNRYFTFSDPFLVRPVLDQFLKIQSDNLPSLGPDWCSDFSKSILNSLINEKKQIKNNNDLAVIEYFQFIISINPLYYYVGVNNLNRAYDWALYSICDDLSKSQEKKVESGRLYQFLLNPEVLSIFNYIYAGKWVSSFYYMCRRLSAIYTIASEFIDWSVEVCLRIPNRYNIPAFSDAWSSMACWAAYNQHDSIKFLVPPMELIIKDDFYPSRIKSDFLLCLSTVVANYSSKEYYEWAKYCLSAYADQLRGHQKLQLLFYSIDWGGSDDLNEIKSDILVEINKINYSNLKEFKRNKLKILIERERLIDMVSPFIGSCIEHGEEEFSYQTLLSWYNVKNKSNLIFENTLLIYCNHAFSYRFIAQSKGTVIECDQALQLEQMMKAMNLFLGVSSSVGGSPEFELHQPEIGRLGIPSEGESINFEKALINFYHFDALKNNVAETIDSYVLLPGHSHPFQYLTNKYLSKVWPYSVSLEEPLKDKDVHRICLWTGAGSFTEEMEVVAIKSVFSGINVIVDYYSSDITTLNKFREVYQSDKYDIIWVMSHGEYDHWEVGNAGVCIGKDEFLSLEEALNLKIPSNESRRLLFLNVCDGAKHAHTGGIAKIGFAPALSNNSQCVISHLWPVNPLSAALFGVLLSIFIRDGNNFFSAYKKALSTISEGNESIVSLFDEYEELSLISNRLINQDIDCSLMAHAGSSAFFQ